MINRHVRSIVVLLAVGCGLGVGPVADVVRCHAADSLLESAPGDPEPAPEDPAGHTERGAFTDTADIDLALFSGAVFLILLAVLSFTAWKPIMAGLKDREDRIAGQIEEARLNADRSKALLAEHEAKLAAARNEIDELHAKARRDAEALAERVRAEAAADAEMRLKRVASEIESAKKSAMDDIARQSVDLAVGLAGKMIAREVSADVHNELIRKSLDSLRSKPA